MKLKIKKIIIHLIKKKKDLILFYIVFLYYFLKNINQVIFKKGQPLIIAVDRPRFNLDANEIKKNNKIRLIVVSRKIFYFIGSIFINKHYQFQSSYHFKDERDIELWNETIGAIHKSNHEPIPNFEINKNLIEENKLKLYSYYEYLFKRYLDKLNINSFLISNIDYWEVQEFSRVLRKNNVKVAALYRESVGSKKQVEYLRKFYKSKSFKDLPIDKIFVFGQNAKKIFQDTNFISNSDIHSIGIPRIDSYKKYNKNLTKNMVTIFNFSLPSYKLQKTSIETLEVVNKISKIYPKYKFLIKTKTNKETKELKSMGIIDNFSNIEISDKTKMKTIIEKSKIIIGTNTTAVIETLFLDAFFIYPSWNIDEGGSENLIVDNTLDRNQFIICDSKLDFEERLTTQLEAEVLISNDEFQLRSDIISQNIEDFSFNSSEKLVDILLF